MSGQAGDPYPNGRPILSSGARSSDPLGGTTWQPPRVAETVRYPSDGIGIGWGYISINQNESSHNWG